MALVSEIISNTNITFDFIEIRFPFVVSVHDSDLYRADN
jgi:hypothetical protein